ncbi:MAG: hypothetical protein P1P88_01980 [Bacteroidales bacterium]|nr:hypothetical protein [Bacteroidales bacterium]
MTLLVVTILIFLTNIPFGYWRANVKKLSFQWFLSIHLPIPFIFLARIYTDIGFHWTTYLFSISAFFLGQLTGKKLYNRFKENIEFAVSSCLVMDLYRRF